MPIKGFIPDWLTPPRLAALVCAVLLLTFAVISYSAAWTKSATWDEPEHLLGSYIHKHYSDYRINPEDPALFGRIASIPLPAGAIQVDLDEPFFQQIQDDTAWQWAFIWRTLYRTGGNDPEPLLRRSRAVCLLVGVALGAAVAWWAYLLGGATAAVAATVLFAFCPNFLAHSSLVKNDVMLSAAILGLMFAVWRFGRRGTPWNLLALSLLAGAAVSVKYSGVLAAGFVVVALVARALLPQPWNVMGMSLDDRLKRLAGAAGGIVVAAVISYGCIWASYGFRYRPAPDPAVALNMNRVLEQSKVNEIFAQRIRQRMRETGQNVHFSIEVESPDEEQIALHRPSIVVRAALWMNDHRLLPQTWLYGFLYTYKSTLIRGTYLAGEYRLTGWWYFFPLAMLFKTPLATIVAAALVLSVAMTRPLNRLIARKRRPVRCPNRACRAPTSEPGNPVCPRCGTRIYDEVPATIDRWALVCVAIAPLIYGASAMTTNLNLGLRHVLPIYPFIFVVVGIVIAQIVHSWSWTGRIIVGVLGAGLVVETLAAYPHYIAFFNTPSGGIRGGIRLLADSSLDWGQDLKLLRDWQRHNPDERLYLSYFGVEDPEYHGIRAIHLPGGYIFAQYTANPPQAPDKPGVVAISATNLLGVYLGPDLRPVYRELLEHEPLEVLGGSIYLYPFPLPPRDSPQ